MTTQPLAHLRLPRFALRTYAADSAMAIGEESADKPLGKFGSKGPASPATRPDWPRPIRAQVAKLTRLAVPADLDTRPPDWTEADKRAFEQRWGDK